MPAPCFRLARLPANAAYAFVFGDSLVRMGDELPLLYPRREAAIAAAICQGLYVALDGTVRILPPREPKP